MRRFLALLILLFSANAFGQVNAATCNTSDVQSAINAATEGQTVQVPSGNCTWTSGVTISGKGITVNGAGTGRAVAYSSSTLTLGTGSKSLTVASTRVDGTHPLGPNVSQTLTLSELGNRQNFMTGTVTSFNSSTGALVMSITSNGGTCGIGSGTNSPSNCARWIVLTKCSTCITDNASSTLFSITEDSSVHTTLQNIELDGGTGTGDLIDLIGGGGAAIIVQNMRWAMNANADVGLHSAINRGLISNVTCDFTPFSQAPICVDPQPFDTTAWETTAYWGSLDTNGQHALYIETSDFHACLNCFDNDEGARSVIRYSFFNNAGAGGHGVDTGPLGARTFEYYSNTGNFNGYSSCTPTCFTFPMNWWMFVRGGSFVFYNNNLPALTSQDYGTKDDINMTVMNLQRNAGTTYTACWGAGTSNGADYHAPHQVGMGCTTSGCSSGSGGTGTDGKGNNIYSTSPFGYGNQYVGDSEPAYIWGNSRQPLTNVLTSDYGLSNSDSCTGSTYDTSANYIKINRDYFNGSTAKPGYTAYAYPHPLLSSNPQASTPTFAPAAGTYTGTQSIVISAGSGGVICYTTNGSTPTTNGSTNCTNGTKYASPVSVASSQTLKAVAGGTGFSDSFTGSAVYTILTQAVTPTFSPTAGTYTGTQNISISTTTGSVICYSLTVTPATNGTTGCSAGSLYSSAVAVAATGILRAVAGGTGLTDSSVGSAGYTINNFPLTPPTQFTGNTVITGPTGVH